MYYRKCHMKKMFQEGANNKLGQRLLRGPVRRAVRIGLWTLPEASLSEPNGDPAPSC